MTSFEITKLTALKDYDPTAKKETVGCLTKTFGIENGNVTKKFPGKINEGKFRTFSVTLEQFKAGLAGFKSNEAICTGTHIKEEFGKIITQRFYNYLKNKNDFVNACPKTKEFFIYKNQPTLFLFDVDGVDKSVDEVIEILSELIHGFNDAEKLIVPSSSSGLHDETGNLVSDSTSSHIYIIIKSGTDAERFMAAVVGRLWLAGHGKIVISKAGSMLERCLIDSLVASSERIIYEANPVLLDGVTQKRPEPRLIAGNILDSTLTLDLTGGEQEDVKEIISKAKDECRGEAERAKEKHLERLAGNIVKSEKRKGNEITKKHALACVRAAAKGKLDDNFLLYFAHKPKPVSVGDVKAAGEEFDSKSLADPMEPTYDGGSRTKAIFYWNDGENPIINSFAHGTARYTFVKAKGEKEKKSADNKTATDATMSMMLKRFVYMRDGNNVIDLDKPPQYAKMKKVEFMTAFLTLGDVWVNNKPKQAIQAFFCDKRRKAVVGERYHPSEPQLYRADGVRWFNPFHMPVFALTSARDKIHLLTDHLEYLFPGGQMARFVNWLAWTVIVPGVRMKNTPLLIAKNQGTGRGYLVQLITKLLGSWNCTSTEMPVLCGVVNEGQYHNYLSNSLFCAMHEVKVSGKDAFAVDDKIRSKLTEPELNLNLKFGRNGTVPIFTNFLMMSNHMDALVLTSDDRRIDVFEHFAPAKDEDYYDELYLALDDNDFLRQVKSWLVEKKALATEFNPTGRAYSGLAKERLIGGGGNDIEIWFKEFCNIYENEVTTFGDIVEIMTEMCREEQDKTLLEAEGYIAENSRQIMALIKETFGKCNGGKRMKIDGQKKQVWALKNLEFWVNTNDTKMIRKELKGKNEETPF